MAGGDEVAAAESETEEDQEEDVMRKAMRFWRPAAALIFSAMVLTLPARSQDHSKHDHDADTTSRGNSAMGFDADKTTHHFLQTSAGGTIQVTANDAADTANRDTIQHHLQHIAERFKSGDFDIPMFVHDQVPPRVPAMKRLKSEISYKYVAMDRGGRVEISTKNTEAIAAIHEFLRFQIVEHQTGDPQ